ncbi:Hydrogen peroxide-inducible genes activator [Stieleria maiorica]|uniref:Hydrogen peroxide-inducible genes activator n=1 Tax=Stieleria maiorica TaxID=2795974 RepID=A0A5B9ME62_9BACT|nr:LysR family transcriptional regulator [Stieleria maiorica]QEF99571.1 Hydrogen peroxide-inducible genes activator [Stieleria maiorica]
MELDQLRYFLQVACDGNFTRAAEHLGISQPALSRSIGRLEEELGQPVFERQARCVALTDAGRLLQGRAKEVLVILEDTLAEIVDDGRSGRIRVGAIPTIAPFFLPELLRRFATDYPDATVVVQEQTTDALLKDCADGKVDLAILALPIEAKYLEIETLLDEELMLVLPPDHELVSKPSIVLSDIEQIPFVLLGEAHCLSDNIVSFCKQQSFHPVSVERTSQMATVQELVSLSHGISMIPMMARRLDQSDRRVYRSLSGVRPTRTIVAVWNPYRYQSRLLESFRQTLRAYASS